MTPTEILSAEHRVIERMLTCLDRMADEAARGGSLDVRSAGAAIEFLRTFADGCHHGKEERHLFRALVEKGWPRERGPVGMMLADHDEGRALIRQMDEALAGAARREAAAPSRFAAAAHDYVDLMRGHIHKEDRVLFPMADRTFAADEQEALLAAFASAESEEMGAGTHERMLAIARELSERYGLAPAEAPAACSHGH